MTSNPKTFIFWFYFFIMLHSSCFVSHFSCHFRTFGFSFKCDTYTTSFIDFATFSHYIKYNLHNFYYFQNPRFSLILGPIYNRLLNGCYPVFIRALLTIYMKCSSRIRFIERLMNGTLPFYSMHQWHGSWWGKRRNSSSYCRTCRTIDFRHLLRS